MEQDGLDLRVPIQARLFRDASSHHAFSEFTVASDSVNEIRGPSYISSKVPKIREKPKERRLKSK